MKKALVFVFALALLSGCDKEEEKEDVKTERQYVKSDITMVVDTVEYCKKFLWLFPFNYNDVKEVENYIISCSSEKKGGVWYYDITLTTRYEADPEERMKVSEEINKRIGATADKMPIWKETAESWTWSERF